MSDLEDGRWRAAADFLAALDDGERGTLGDVAGSPGTSGVEEVLAALRGSGAGEGPSEALALAGVRVGVAGERELSRRIGEAALGLARTLPERQLAHACLAQSAFRHRKDPESLAAFERHCERAVELGHAGTFCYERLAVLYEYRGDYERAVAACLRAEEALAQAGDERSAASFRERAAKISHRKEKRQGERPEG